MKETGKIIKIGKGIAEIEIAPEKACTKCCSCGASRVRHIKININDRNDLSVGDEVEYWIDTSSILRTYFLIYAVPLAAFLSGIFVFYMLSRSPGISFAGAAVLTIGTYFLISLVINRYPRFIPPARVKKV